jgi:putative ABC transport system permease protein
MTLWTVSLRELERRPVRALLTLLGISLGLATVVATRLTAQTVSVAYRELFESTVGAPGLEVTAPALAGFDPEVARCFEGVPGLRAVCPRVHGAVTVVGPSGGMGVPLLGITEAEHDDWPIQTGTLPHSAEEVALDGELAEGLGVQPGQPVRLWTPAGQLELRIAGTLAPRAAWSGSAGLVLVTVPAAQRMLQLNGRINSLRLSPSEGAAPEAVRSEVASRLPRGLTLHAPGGHAERARSTLQAAEQGLATLGVMALVAAGFVILQTVLLELGERRRQLAILKTIGATRWQILRLLLREILCFGLLGTLLGWGLGYALARLLLLAMERFLGLPVPALRLTAGPFLLAGMLGPLTALAAALLPTWSASRRPVLDELSPRRGEEAGASPGWSACGGCLLLGVGLVLALGLCRGWYPPPTAQAVLSPTIALLLGGSVLAFPLLLGPFFSLVSLSRWGFPGSLAGQQLARRRTRSGLTAGALFLALAVTIGFGHSLGGILRDVQQWYGHTILADYLVRGSQPDTAFVLTTALPETLGKRLNLLPRVDRVEQISFLPGSGHGQDVLILARTFADRAPLPLELQEGNPDEVRRRLQDGEVVLGAGLAGQLGLHVGDHFTLDRVNGAVSLRIAGTATEFAAGGSALYLEWRTACRQLEVPGVHVFLVTARPGAVQRLAGDLDAFCKRHRLQVQSNAGLRQRIEQSLSRLTGVIWSLVALLVVVASLGIVNTMAMTLYEQRPLFQTLQALGLRRTQQVRLVLLQGLLLGGFSLPPGALAGLGLAWLISRSSLFWAGNPISFRVDLGLIAWCCGLALACTVLGCLLHVRRATQGAEAARLPVG